MKPPIGHNIPKALPSDVSREVALAACSICDWSATRPTIAEATAAGEVHALTHRRAGGRDAA